MNPILERFAEPVEACFALKAATHRLKKDGVSAFADFHSALHKTNTRHWIERRADGSYVLWGERAEYSALAACMDMSELPIGTRVEG